MSYKGIVKGKMVQLEDEVTFPDGTRVNVTPEDSVAGSVLEYPMTLKMWLQEARQIRKQLPKTSDSAETLRQLRDQRAN